MDGPITWLYPEQTGYPQVGGGSSPLQRGQVPRRDDALRQRCDGRAQPAPPRPVPGEGDDLRVHGRRSQGRSGRRTAPRRIRDGPAACRRRTRADRARRSRKPPGTARAAGRARRAPPSRRPRRRVVASTRTPAPRSMPHRITFVGRVVEPQPPVPDDGGLAHMVVTVGQRACGRTHLAIGQRQRRQVAQFHPNTMSSPGVRSVK